MGKKVVYHTYGIDDIVRSVLTGTTATAVCGFQKVMHREDVGVGKRLCLECTQKVPENSPVLVRATWLGLLENYATARISAERDKRASYAWKWIGELQTSTSTSTNWPGVA